MRLLTSLAVFTTLAATPQLRAQAATVPAQNASLKQEIALSYQRGLAFLKSKQDSATGQWGEAEPVAFTGLMSACFLMDPNRDPGAPAPAEAQKGLAFLLKNVQPDGGIYVKARGGEAELPADYQPTAEGAQA